MLPLDICGKLIGQPLSKTFVSEIFLPCFKGVISATSHKSNKYVHSAKPDVHFLCSGI